MTGQLTWLVTGCSSGFGEAFVRAILAKVAIVLLRQRVEVTEFLVELDVTASQEELNAKAREAWEIYGQVDVLVNNAGYVEAGIFEELDEKTTLDALRTNVLGPLNLRRSFIPLMRSAKRGTILFVGSVGIYYGAPGANCYTGGKGLIEGMVPNLAVEIASFGIRTCILVTGHFRTGLMSPANTKFRAPNPQPEYNEINGLIRAGLAAQDGNQPGDPKKACELVVEAVRGEGRCEGKELPLRLPLGSDAFKYIRDNCTERSQLCDEWEGIMSQTDV